jgi:phosphoribosylaminoimidazole-succinocarboxamide synthase
MVPPASDEAAVDSPLFESTLRSLPLLARGKVRDNYAVGNDRMLMVASDRLSAFDVVMGEPIPGKGRVLTKMALFWFARLGHIVPNHLTGADPESVVAADEREQVRGRAMLVKRLRPLPIEAVVRGYLAGSGWKEYQASGAVCGVSCRGCAGRKLPEPSSPRRRRRWVITTEHRFRDDERDASVRDRRARSHTSIALYRAARRRRRCRGASSSPTPGFELARRRRHAP